MKDKEVIIRLEHIHDLMNPKIRSTKFNSVSDALDTVEIGVAYNMFDLEATRRERDNKKKK